MRSLRAAIWKNQTETGVRFNTTFGRLYKDGDKWDSSDSFGRDDLLLLAKVADMAHTWICALKQDGQNSAQARPATETAEA